MNAIHIPQAIPDTEYIERLVKSGMDYEMAVSWAQTRASLRQFLEVEGAK